MTRYPKMSSDRIEALKKYRGQHSKDKADAAYHCYLTDPSFQQMADYRNVLANLIRKESDLPRDYDTWRGSIMYDLLVLSDETQTVPSELIWKSRDFTYSLSYKTLKHFYRRLRYILRSNMENMPRYITHVDNLLRWVACARLQRGY